MFKKGCPSPNPKGRPKGILDKRTELRGLLKPSAPALIQVAVDLALSGDTVALKICLDRCIPVIKPISEAVNTGLQIDGLSLAEQGKEIYRKAASGELDLDAASTLMGMLSARVKIDEFTELEERLSRLEETGVTNGKARK